MKKRISVLLCMLLFLGVLSGCGQSGEKLDVFGGSHLKQAALYPAGAEEPSAVITDPETLEQIETWMGTRLGPNSFTCVSRAAEEAVDAVRVYYDEVLQVYEDIEDGRVDVDRPD